ncbi:glycosyl hydrolase 108 family protein [Methylopila sp. M107]|uniref:glycosyl hydrolase 108 family protein n=1 Tax=Methylopila sp. M107 TaxID=1101190 RepID=UPI00039DCD4F|nr:glycosyl hydrolase 108 family protein [Methylopila sp. M107]
MSDASLDEQRLALEKWKAEQDLELRRREAEQKAREGGWISRLFSPLTTTIMAGVLTLAASALATILQGENTLTLERQKFEASEKLEKSKFETSRLLEAQKQEHELILKMISVGDEKQARANIQFLADIGLLSEERAKKVAQLKTFAVLPTANSAAPVRNRIGRSLSSDEDIIDLIVQWEGGFIAPGDDDSRATNGGVTLAALSKQLGRPATLDELKALDRAKIGEIYKAETLTPDPLGRVADPAVKGALANAWVMSGPRAATVAFQRAMRDAFGKEVVIDGMAGARFMSLINGFPDRDLLIETANCALLDQLKSNPAFASFRPGWVARLKDFTPGPLKGLCADMAPGAAEIATAVQRTAQ